MQNEKDGDFGYDWLKTNYAGSGPFTIRDWKANEVVVLERNANYEQEGAARPRHLPPHQGDRDAAPAAREGRRRRRPQPRPGGARRASRKNPDIKIDSGAKGTVYYLGLNQKNPNLAKPEVREALK